MGGVRHVECWSDDVPHGETTDFIRAVKAEDGESVVFSWIEYPSKEVRDAANAKMRDDARMKEWGQAMDFVDGSAWFSAASCRLWTSPLAEFFVQISVSPDGFVGEVTAHAWCRWE